MKGHGDSFWGLDHFGKRIIQRVGRCLANPVRKSGNQTVLVLLLRLAGMRNGMTFIHTPTVLFIFRESQTVPNRVLGQDSKWLVARVITSLQPAKLTMWVIPQVAIPTYYSGESNIQVPIPASFGTRLARLFKGNPSSLPWVTTWPDSDSFQPAR